MPWTILFTFEDVNFLFGPLKYMRLLRLRIIPLRCHHVENDKKKEV